MSKIKFNILYSLLIFALLIFVNWLIERFTIFTQVDYKLLIVIAIWLIALWLGFLLITELISYHKPDSLIRKIIDKWDPFGPSFPSLLNVALMMVLGMLLLLPMSALILETVGWEYKNILIPPGVIFGLSVSWAWIAWQATEVYQKEWSELLHPATESKDHKSSRKRLFDIIALLSTFSYIFTCVILIGLVGQKYLIFIILLGILAVLGVDKIFFRSPEKPVEIKNKLIEPMEITPEIKEEISCINCNYTQQRSATELCSNCGLNIYVKVEYQTCTNCGSEFQTGLANCPIC